MTSEPGEPQPCDVVCPEHSRHCAYAWSHEQHHCVLDPAWRQEPLTAARVAQLRALGIDVVTVGR
ncbi:hypothetical protein ACIBF5_29675 [Micromonospora sp. NPDC050417]|uniref:hypothetical protein n=1 Tax=Micromonospora sp. NPDC050417 TaxID=3364280 RepID=UPI0037A9F3F6